MTTPHVSHQVDDDLAQAAGGHSSLEFLPPHRELGLLFSTCNCDESVLYSTCTCDGVSGFLLLLCLCCGCGIRRYTAAAAPLLRPLLTSTPRPRLMLRTLWWVLQFKSRAHQMPRMEISRNKLPALKKLHDVGTISNEDFENKKAVLLSRM